MAPSSSEERFDRLVGWLSATIARACDVERDAVSAESTVLELGLDSLTLASVLAQLEITYEIELLPDDTFALLEAADVRALALRLAAIIDARKPPDGAG